jgi:hypothetical protein
MTGGAGGSNGDAGKGKEKVTIPVNIKSESPGLRAGELTGWRGPQRLKSGYYRLGIHPRRQQEVQADGSTIAGFHGSRIGGGQASSDSGSGGGNRPAQKTRQVAIHCQEAEDRGESRSPALTEEAGASGQRTSTPRPMIFGTWSCAKKR